MNVPNPYAPVILFEKAIAEYCGAPFAVSTESCTSALFLCLMWEVENAKKKRTQLPRVVTMPARSYPGVACSIINAGFKIRFTQEPWHGEYQLEPFNIWDSALRFKRGMYHGGFQCLSFHIKKNLPIGRGSCILTEDEDAVNWLKKARFDGRNAVPLQEDSIEIIGWNYYMTPDQGSRGLQLLQALGDRELPDLKTEDQHYSDLSVQPAYQKYIV